MDGAVIDGTVDLSCFMSKRSPRDEALKVVSEDGLLLKKASYFDFYATRVYVRIVAFKTVPSSILLSCVSIIPTYYKFVAILGCHSVTSGAPVSIERYYRNLSRVPHRTYLAYTMPQRSPLYYPTHPEIDT